MGERKVITPAIAGGVLFITALLSFGGGFAVSDWRSGEQVARLESDNAVLRAANNGCATDIKVARAAMLDIERAYEYRAHKAAEEARAAQPGADVHTRRAAQTKALPAVAVEWQCEAITREQIEYVQTRE